LASATWALPKNLQKFRKISRGNLLDSVAELPAIMHSGSRDSTQPELDFFIPRPQDLVLFPHVRSIESYYSRMLGTWLWGNSLLNGFSHSLRIMHSICSYQFDATYTPLPLTSPIKDGSRSLCLWINLSWFEIARGVIILTLP